MGVALCLDAIMVCIKRARSLGSYILRSCSRNSRNSETVLLHFSFFGDFERICLEGFYSGHGKCLVGERIATET